MPRLRSSTPKQRVEFGLRTIPKARRVSVSLRDLMYVHQVIQEYVCFFHQPKHFPKKQDIEQFLGNASSPDAYAVLCAAREKLRPMLPKDIIAAFGEGVRFEHPLPPAYYEEKA